MKRFFAILLLVLWSVTAAGPAGAIGRVWCVGQDGHAAIEFAMGPACAESSVSFARTADESASVYGDHCGECIDTALSVCAPARHAVVALSPPALKTILSSLAFTPVISLSDGLHYRPIANATAWNLSLSHLQRKSVALRR